MVDGELVMASSAEVAERDGITKQAVTKMVRALVEEHDIPVDRDGRGRVVRFSLAHFDHYRERFASSEKTSSARKDGKQRNEPQRSLTSRDEALRQEAWLKVARARLQQQEELGSLIRADVLTDAIKHCAREIQNAVSRLPNHSDDLALEVSKEGAHGLRVSLRKIAVDLNRRIADQLEKIAKTAPAHDPMMEDTEA